MSIRPTGSQGGSPGQALVEFTLVLPILLVLLLVVGDFARLFATGIAVESAARDAAEVAAQEYLRAPTGSIDYSKIDRDAVATACHELDGQPNAGYDSTGYDSNSDSCAGVPTVVCVHDGVDPNCGVIAPSGVSVPAQCASFASGQLPTNAQTGGTETSRYVEVRLCYRFSTLLNISSIGGIPVPFGDYYIERDRVFTVADY